MMIFVLPLCTLSAESTDAYETDVTFQNFPWGTSIEDVSRKMGRPISQENFNGLTSVAWQGVIVGEYTTYMIAYFSESGLQAGAYYFVTHDMDHMMSCYKAMQQDLRARFGPTNLFDTIIRELRPYESSWHLPGGYVLLKVNARLGEPVTIWYSSPELTKQLFGEVHPTTARR